MRYCPDNISRDTIRRDANLYEAYIANLLLRVTPLHYLQKVLSVFVRLGQRTYHDSCNSCVQRCVRGIIFGITCILVILSTITY